ncbi:MAG: Fe-S-containing protein [Bacillota bacterium]
MLESTVFTLKYAVEAAFLLLVLYTLMQTNKDHGPAKNWIAYSIGVSLSISFLLGLLIKFYIDRELVDTILRVLSIINVLVLLGFSWCKTKAFKRIYAAIISFFLVVIPSVEISLFFINLVVRNEGFLNTELLLKFAGGGIALFIAYFLLKNAYGFVIKLPLLQIRLWETLILVLYLGRQLISIFQMTLALGFVPITKFTVSLISPLINIWQPILFYLLIAAGVCWVAYGAYKLPWKAEDEYKNPAESRKALSEIKRRKRSICAFSVLIGLFLSLNLFNYYMENRTIELSPAVPVEADSGLVKISAKELEDNNLHRYSYITSNNIEIRFIAIKKGEGVYGIGLDACEICGTVGYYQRGREVICLNCDVIMNIPTIGFPGGCNPIPLKHDVNGEKIVINEASLLEAEKVFK